MKKIFKGKAGTAIILVFTVILAGIAIFTAVRLYELRQQPVAPNVPSSIPRAAENSACSLSFTLGTSTSSPTPTPTGTSSPTPTPTGTSTPTDTPTVTPTGAPNSCGGTCGSNSNCASNLVCYNGFCRNPSCTSQADCNCPGTTTTPTPTPAGLPKSGTTWPTTMGAGVGILVVFGSILLAL